LGKKGKVKNQDSKETRKKKNGLWEWKKARKMGLCRPREVGKVGVGRQTPIRQNAKVPENNGLKGTWKRMLTPQKGADTGMVSIRNKKKRWIRKKM